MSYSRSWRILLALVGQLMKRTSNTSRIRRLFLSARTHLLRIPPMAVGCLATVEVLTAGDPFSDLFQQFLPPLPGSFASLLVRFIRVRRFASAHEAVSGPVVRDRFVGLACFLHQLS